MGEVGFASTFLNARVAAEYAPRIAEGLALTVALAALVVAAGLAAGLGLAVARAALRSRWLAAPIVVFVDVFRALPPLVVLVLLYFGLPASGLSLSGFWATWLTLALVLAAFSEEVFWAGLQAVPRGQWDAARALGLSFLAALRRVALPQALRMCLPPLANRTVAITKGTALGSVVGVSEVLGAAQSATAFSGNPTPLVLGAAAYLLLFAPVVALARRLERSRARGAAA